MLQGVLALGLGDGDADLLLLLVALQLGHGLGSQLAIPPDNGEAILKRFLCALLPLLDLAHVHLLGAAVLDLVLKNLLVHRRDRDLHADPSIFGDTLELEAGFTNLAKFQVIIYKNRKPLELRVVSFQT